MSSSIALISDAGAPLISDPGYNLVQSYIKKEISITTIPGASSIISALQLSGLPINNFEFLGFVPKNSQAIKNFVTKIEAFTSTKILFIPNRKLVYFLKTISEKKITNQISVCKELTKKNENVFRGTASEILEKISLDDNSLKGEFILIIEAKEKKSIKNLDLNTKKQIAKLLEKFSLTEVVEIVHKLTNISKKEVYKNALLSKND